MFDSKNKQHRLFSERGSESLLLKGKVVAEDCKLMNIFTLLIRTDDVYHDTRMNHCLKKKRKKKRISLLQTSSHASGVNLQGHFTWSRC